MDSRNRVKQLLRMCGHAFVGTVHERLDVLQRQIDNLNAQNVSLGETQAALLKASIHIVELLRQMDEDRRQRDEGLRQHLDRLLEQGVENARQARDAITALHNYIRPVFDEELVRQVCVETSHYEFTNPETGLMSFLYSYLPTRRAIDVGANVGDVSECLLRSGYEVYAFEPFPPVYERLVRRLGRHDGFHPFNFALGCEEGVRRLHLAKDLSGSNRYDDVTGFSSLVAHSMPDDDLPVTGDVPVKVKTLAGLHAERAVPEDIGLVKIDTEGFDLEVVRGMREFWYPVVAAEYWDSEIPFGRAGLLYTLESLVGEMKNRGYLWHIVLYRVWGRNQTAFCSNHSRPVPNSWGNVFFFRDYGVFSQGQAWCAAVLPRTYFKPVAG